MSAPTWPRFGVHAGFYGGAGHESPADEMRRLWTTADDLGFDWISVWDHFFDPSSREPGYCFDVVAMQSALACATQRARCGALVYCAAYRSAAVIAGAIATIDHLSGGRAELGLGAGWSSAEFRASGIEFAPFAARIARLEEMATCVRLLLSGEPVSFDGAHLRLDGARCYPGPVQDHLPIWVGGRSVAAAQVAARVADGLNLPYIGPEVVEWRRAQIDGWATAVGRRPADVRLAVNVAVALDEDEYERQFGNVIDHVGAGVVVGGAGQIAAAARSLLDAGADQVNFTLRAPWPPGMLDVLGETLDRVRRPTP